MRLKRGSGILMHPTCLPGEHGIGSLGKVAFEFIDLLVAGGQSYWQVLPLGPPGYGNSPYQSFSAFAGFAGLIDLQLLAKAGLLTNSEIKFSASGDEDRIDYEEAKSFKSEALRKAFNRFGADLSSKKSAFAEFEIQNAHWLDDYSLFCALRQIHGNSAWQDWPEPIRKRDASALNEASGQLGFEIAFHKFQQFIFFNQMQALHSYAKSRGIQIIGDMPIFIASDSVDAWSHPDYFKIDANGQLEVVAGVPPDYFSAKGQRWGNPVYRWDVLKRTGYLWWIKRFKAASAMADCVRIDHFRGFEKFWEIPADHPDATRGAWAEGPGIDFFNSLNAAGLPISIIAEDLGFITPEVIELRDNCGFPGMKILQFAFGDDSRNPYLPHNFDTPNCIVYTGTHDNDTTIGWHAKPSPDKALAKKIRTAVRRYAGTDAEPPHWVLMRLALASIANVAIIPIQDLLGYGSDARMNTPGSADGNWRWKLANYKDLKKALPKLRDVSKLFSR
jgi:4-alpha-glucanotransferase